MIKDNESICSECGELSNDDISTIFDIHGDPYCNECYLKIYGKDAIYVSWVIKSRMNE